MNVLILRPRFDLPFKPGMFPSEGLAHMQVGQVAELRGWWARFVDEVAVAFENAGHRSKVIELPNWQFTPAVVNALAPDLVFVPHRQASQFEGLECPALFYMQMFFRNVFTVDHRGWGAGHSAYPCDYSAGDPDADTYDVYRERLKANSSKFGQPDRVGREKLIEDGLIPDAPYIFFPCQIPHDETILLHSDVGEVEVVQALARWANESGTHVVFKAHPVNPASQQRLIEAVGRGPFVRWADASVHDLIEHAEAVYTINSGVGFEAIIHGKPVATFGRCEYDCVTDARTLETIGEPPATFESAGANAFIESQRRMFVDWYIRHHAIDLADRWRLSDRLDRVVAQGEALVAGR